MANLRSCTLSSLSCWIRSSIKFTDRSINQRQWPAPSRLSHPTPPSFSWIFSNSPPPTALSPLHRLRGLRASNLLLQFKLPKVHPIGKSEPYLGKSWSTDGWENRPSPKDWLEKKKNRVSKFDITQVSHCTRQVTGRVTPSSIVQISRLVNNSSPGGLSAELAVKEERPSHGSRLCTRPQSGRKTLILRWWSTRKRHGQPRQYLA